MTSGEHQMAKMQTGADVLREAARLMRERAEAASPPPWKSWIEGRDHRGGDSIITHPDVSEGMGDIYADLVTVNGAYHRNWKADQDYIAAMHPGVALVVADWLDDIALLMPPGRFAAPYDRRDRHALAVARAYLGSAS